MSPWGSSTPFQNDGIEVGRMEEIYHALGIDRMVDARVSDHVVYRLSSRLQLLNLPASRPARSFTRNSQLP